MRCRGLRVTWSRLVGDGVAGYIGTALATSTVTLFAPCSVLLLQDNQLQELPDISHHPHLTSLQLDSNQLRHIVPAAGWSLNCSSSSSSGAGGIGQGSVGVLLQQHSCLQTLSLANNSITSICASSAAQHSSSSAHGAGPTLSRSNTTTTSSSSSRGPPGSMLPGLSSWLVGLQTLRLPGNQLQDLTGLEGCSNLTKLDVSRNQLTCLQVRTYVHKYMRM